MTADETAARRAIIDACLEMTASGLNQGTSGNVSVRAGARMLITPSAVPYARMEPAQIASVALDDPSGAWEGPVKPSTEWRFHHALMKSRADAGAVVHAHPPHATALAIARREIPACHYMVAAFGGATVRCSGYARFGTEALSELVLAAMEGRTACLMANHGILAIGETLEKAMWRAHELEALARHYILSLPLGPVILSEAEIAETLEAFAGYGLTQD